MVLLKHHLKFLKLSTISLEEVVDSFFFMFAKPLTLCGSMICFIKLSLS